MNKNWSLLLVVAFVLGLAINSYITQQGKLEDPQSSSSTASKEAYIFFSKEGQAVDVFDTEDDRIRIIYFGFTRCPDVCPTSLAMLAGALNELDEPSKSNIRPMFISLDPERDQAETAYQYAQYFHPLIEGLSAPLSITTDLAHRYGVIFRKTELESSQLDYTVDHSSYFYFTKPDGTLITKVPHTLTPTPLIEAINQLKNNNEQ
ncbi:SCO family protein [Vibrio sp. ZSDE26]|uniref:SCO family protein n=1 Tax=Vibrio amylolyticus TaxID=2847292 RepID=A0A9X1XNQ4_9VIBR|nr:SCO family protein [Vibrio amylolyticus]MCK6264325.1 SCO family protein [Vibrio amylolyticus]